MTTTPTLDVIDKLLGDVHAEVLAEIRDARPDARAVFSGGCRARQPR
jgi:hypothetical protein